MLEQKDIEILKSLMQEVVKESEENILNKVDERISASEESILSKVDERVSASEESILSKVDERISASEHTVLSKMDERISASENLVLNELDRVQTHLEKEVDEVRENLDEMKQFYRINKLESDNTTLLLQMYNNMQKEIEEIKTKIA
ncbi:hypothetical protein [Blautia sp.]|uniref:Uncharacterized protein n=1 Tax=Blautia glucerasea TaxID=536633 RepID=A0A6N2SKV6_9FIRM